MEFCIVKMFSDESKNSRTAEPTQIQKKKKKETKKKTPINLSIFVCAVYMAHYWLIAAYYFMEIHQLNLQTNTFFITSVIGVILIKTMFVLKSNECGFKKKTEVEFFLSVSEECIECRAVNLYSD